MAFLTIDDAPSPRLEAKLEALARHGIKAVFFVQGDRIAGREDVLVRTLREGHLLANHAWTHRGFSTLGPNEGREEVDRTHTALAALYARAGIPWTLKLFRFPYLDPGSDPAQRRAWQGLLTEYGYRTPVGWPGDGADCGCSFDQREYWLGNPQAPEGLSQASAILARIDADHPAAGDVILIHDHEYSHEVFLTCLDLYRAAGRTFALP